MPEWLEYSSEWGYWINPDTFRTPRIKKSIRVGAVFFEKNRETLDDGRQVIVTTYGVARTDGKDDMGKREASSVLSKQMYEFMRKKEMFPPKTTVKKVFANGNVDLSYDPSDFDSFTIRITPTMVGGDVEEFLNSLREFTEKEVDDVSWKVEPAKSSRSTCKTCDVKIEKGELRLGEPSLFDDHVSYRWHHLSCQSQQLRWMDLDSLEGYSELSDEQKNSLLDTKDG